MACCTLCIQLTVEPRADQRKRLSGLIKVLHFYTKILLTPKTLKAPCDLSECDVKFHLHFPPGSCILISFLS